MKEKTKKSKKAKHNTSNLSNRQQKSFDDKDKGGTRSSVFDWKKVENVKFFEVKADSKKKYKISVVPFVIKSKNHPLVATGDFSIGDVDYVMDYWVHPFMGPSQAEILCLAKNYKKPCPLCEYQKKLYDEGKKKEAEAYKAKRKVAYNIIDENNPDDGIQVFQVSHFSFEKELVEEARASSDGDGLVDYTSLDNGKAICFRVEEEDKTINGKPSKVKEYKSFSFKDRTIEITDDMIDQAISFDELLNVHKASEIEELVFSASDDEDDDKPSKNKRRNKKDEEEDDEEEEDLDEDEDEDEEDDDSDSEEDDNDSEEEEDDEEESDDEDDEEESDDEDDEEESDEDDEEEEDIEIEIDDEEDEKPAKKGRGKAKAKPATKKATAKGKNVKKGKKGK